MTYESSNDIEQMLLQRALDVFHDHFGVGPRLCAKAPGRVNLIGEHTDYNNGFVLPMAIQRHTIVVGRMNRSMRCRVIAADLNEEQATFLNNDSISPGRSQWANYVKGILAMFKRNGHPIPSFDLVIASSIPLGGGLSSSAALEVAIATFMEQILGAYLPLKTKAKWCYEAEHEYAGVPCGIMDQSICIQGLSGHALLIDCQSLHSEPIPLSDPNVTIVVTNSNLRDQLSGGEYAKRRRQCELAVAALQCRFPEIRTLRDATAWQLGEVKQNMDPVLYQRARHVIAENERVGVSVDALRRNDYETFGRMMLESHRSLCDDYQVSCPEVDSLVSAAMEVDGVYGSRMTGGGFGGCTVTLARTEVADALMAHIEDRYYQQAGRRAESFATRPEDGARPIVLAEM